MAFSLRRESRLHSLLDLPRSSPRVSAALLQQWPSRGAACLSTRKMSIDIGSRSCLMLLSRCSGSTRSKWVKHFASFADTGLNSVSTCEDFWTSWMVGWYFDVSTELSCVSLDQNLQKIQGFLYHLELYTHSPGCSARSPPWMSFSCRHRCFLQVADDEIWRFSSLFLTSETSCMAESFFSAYRNVF